MFKHAFSVEKALISDEKPAFQTTGHATNLTLKTIKGDSDRGVKGWFVSNL